MAWPSLLLAPPEVAPPLGQAVVLNGDSAQAAGLVGCWPAHVAPGAATVLERTGQGAAGVWAGTLRTVMDPRLGGLHQFALSSADRISMGDVDGYDFPGSFSLTAWVRSTMSDAGAFGSIAGKGYLAGQNGYGLFFTSAGTGELVFQVRTGATTCNATAPTTGWNDGRPHCLVGVRDHGADTTLLYIDGVLQHTNTVALTSYSSAAAFALGARQFADDLTWDHPLRGEVGEVRLYNRALSAAEAWQLYDPLTRWALYTPPRRVWAVVTAAVQYARPSADVTDGGWTNEVGSATDLYASLDEATASDADYIQSSVNPSSDVAEVALSDVADPGVHTGHIIRFRVWRG